MKIAIVGYGSMGKMIEQSAKSRDITVQAIIDPKAKGASHTELNEQSLAEVDVAIDFTHPSVIMQNIDTYCKTKTNVVIGTTGWYDHIDSVKKQVQDSGIKLLWASNFSVGVNAYFKIIDYASAIFNRLEEYDVWAHEIHHHNKADSPSGTAKTITDSIVKNIDRKEIAVFEKLDRKIEPNEFHFSSTRGGAVNFEHTVGFDSAADCVSIKHAARDRSGYADGSVIAALWLSKKEPGYYELDDFIGELLG